ncbi:hypothetical protein [Kocuria sabuli]|uniref:hypothetical protein n=1 Tax=Kocuria sabuli TaxID=3071448 RepID=UPI0034D72020
MAPWEAIIAAVGVALGGEKAAGRQHLMQCWAGTAEKDHAQRCVLAHYLADLQTDLGQEIAWDRTALAEHSLLEDGDLTAVGIPSARGMAPSLHLNLGEGYLRRGELGKARDHLEQGLFASEALQPDGYGTMIRSGLQGLAQRIEEVSGEA